MSFCFTFHCSQLKCDYIAVTIQSCIIKLHFLHMHQLFFSLVCSVSYRALALTYNVVKKHSFLIRSIDEQLAAFSLHFYLLACFKKRCLACLHFILLINRQASRSSFHNANKHLPCACSAFCKQYLTQVTSTKGSSQVAAQAAQTLNTINM